MSGQTELENLENTVNAAWEDRDAISPSTQGTVRDAVQTVLSMLDCGRVRVASASGGSWTVHEWLKKAVLLSFRLNENTLIEGGPGHSGWWDKVPSKFSGWTEETFGKSGIRAVPGCTVRYGSHIAPSAVLMPCFVNIGARIDAGTMIDTWATVGSCAQIGANCHISGGTGIGGVLEPLQANPVIIEDNVFIGARSEVAEGVIVRKGAVISMGVYLGASTKIVNRDTGEVSYREIPPYSVVVPGTFNAPGSPASLYCAVIVKQVDERTRSRTSLNDLLRD